MGLPSNQGVTAPGSASISDILTTLRNAVQAVNNAAQSYINVQGAQNRSGISATTLVSSKSGRVAQVSVTTLGSSTGTIYDTSTANSLVNPIYIIPEAVGVYIVNLPVGLGIVVTPGTSQILTVSYS